jgi:hypothetical protein
MIALYHKYLLIAVISLAITACLIIATKWLLADIQEDNLKEYTVYGEFVVVKELAVMKAASEEDAIERTNKINYSTEVPEIIWAEENKL